ncbi:hypothetical protein QEN19_000657 [Hanseniaspora menglaensis]
MFNLGNSNGKPGGLFGSTAAPQSQVSQFGTTVTNTTTPQPQTGGLFGNSTNNTNSSTGGMFGNNNTTTSTGGLFGNTNTASTTGGLFGNSNTTSTTGGLFGSKPNTTTSGGLFGNTIQPAQTTGGGLFGSSSINSGNTQTSGYGQQQNQFQPEPLSISKPRKLIVEQAKILPSWTKISETSKQPPREVIRRLTNVGNDVDTNFTNSDASDSDNEFEEDIFGNIGFGKSKKVGSKRLMNKRNVSALELDNTKENTFTLNTTTSGNGDFPPMKSLFDIEKEMEIDHKIQQSRSSPSIITEELTRKAQDFNDFKKLNIFDRSENVRETDKNNILQSKHDSKNDEFYSCTVFGYPENISTQILNHFNKFGTILEDFPFLTNNSSANKTKKLPIETGESWCKITYDNRVSYLRALKENGTLYSGYVIGCVPHTQTSNTKNSINNNLSNNLEDNNQSRSNVTEITERNSKNLNEELLVADIFQKGGVLTTIDTDLDNRKESGKISGKLNHLLFGFNGDSI